MKTDPRYGYYPWWPEDGDDWLHPEDVELARQRLPSMRIYRRDGEQGPFVVLHYGAERLRVLRTLWNEVESESFVIGDGVEALSRGQRNSPRTGTFREMLWNVAGRGIRYQVQENDQPIAKLYSAEDLRHVDPPSGESEARLEPLPAD